MLVARGEVECSDGRSAYYCRRYNGLLGESRQSIRKLPLPQVPAKPNPEYSRAKFVVMVCITTTLTAINPTPYPHIPISPYTHTHIHPYTYTPVHPYTHTPQTVNYLHIQTQKPWEKSDLSNIENMFPLDSKDDS